MFAMQEEQGKLTYEDLKKAAEQRGKGMKQYVGLLGLAQKIKFLKFHF